MNAQKEQQLQLQKLLSEASDTVFGRKHTFGALSSYESFKDKVPLQFYRDIDIEALKGGKADLYWPGSVDKYAVSAGTSGKGKHLPITEDRLKSDRQFMRKVVLSYLRQQPNIFKLMGSHLSLPGSLEHIDGLAIGEISGHTGVRAPVWLKALQVVSPDRLIQLGFKEKFDLLLDKAVDANLKVITAVPSWILTLFQEVLKKTGKQSIAEVWPNLHLMVCGGVKLANYRPHLEKLMGDLNPNFIETYGASEGYFAFSDDFEKDDLKLITDNGIFYEFIADPLPDEESMSIQETIPLWEVEAGVPYAMVISTNAGLWRYAVRDIVEFSSTDPYRIEVKGRVSEMLDDFGEGLYIYEAEEALTKAARKLGVQESAFTIAPTLASEAEVPYHRWFVQFTEPIHTDTLNKMAMAIDEHLIEINRHYAIRRETEALSAPNVSSITQDDINRWMDASGKAKAQGKFPKVLRENVDVFI